MAGRPIGRKLLNKAWYGTYTQNTAQGLQNGGNDCYRLALLQCLIHIPTFCRFIQTAHRPKVRHSAQQCVYCSFHALINEYWITRNPAAFSNFLGSRAVVDLYAAMNASIVIGTANPTPLDVSAVITSVDQEDCMDFWLAVTNMLSPGGQTWSAARMFEIYDVETHTCTTCNQVVSVQNTMAIERMIPINAAPGANNALLGPQGALAQLHNYTQPARCNQPNCIGQQRRVEVRIRHSPEILLMRFLRYDNRARKLSQVMTYPALLNLDQYTRARSTRLRYRLAGVICHRGQAIDNGHFIAFVRNRGDQTCTGIDDDMTVRYDSLQPMLTPHLTRPRFQATYLVYQKLSA